MSIISKTKPKPTFFYGWVMLGIAMIAGMMTTPGQTAGISIFNNSFREALNLSHTQLTSAYGIGTVLASLALPFVGAQMDRYGIRRVMGIVVVLFAGACFFTGTVSNIWLLFLAFFLLRMLGQGSLSLLSQNTTAMWFNRRLGLAQGLTYAGFAIAMTGVPPFFLWIIQTFGWRVAYGILGLIVLVVMLPLILFFFVDRPEDIGQQQDGILTSSTPLETGDQPESENDFTLQEALKTPAYWVMAGLLAVSGAIVTAIYFNGFPFFETRGFTEVEIAWIFSIMGGILAVSQFFAGILADIFPLHRLAVLMMIGYTASMVLLLFVNSMPLAILFAVVHSLSEALRGGVVGPLWAKYYGRAHLGKIRGSVFMAGVIGSGVGPFIMGATFDRFASYTPSIVLFICLYAPFILLTGYAKRPNKPILAE